MQTVGIVIYIIFILFDVLVGLLGDYEQFSIEPLYFSIPILLICLGEFRDRKKDKSQSDKETKAE